MKLRHGNWNISRSPDLPSLCNSRLQNLTLELHHITDMKTSKLEHKRRGHTFFFFFKCKCNASFTASWRGGSAGKWSSAVNLKLQRYLSLQMSTVIMHKLQCYKTYFSKTSLLNSFSFQKWHIQIEDKDRCVGRVFVLNYIVSELMVQNRLENKHSIKTDTT